MVDEGFKLTNEQRAAAIERRAAAHALEHADRLWRFYADWREALEIEAGRRAAEFEAGRARARKMRKTGGRQDQPVRTEQEPEDLLADALGRVCGHGE